MPVISRENALPDAPIPLTKLANTPYFTEIFLIFYILNMKQIPGGFAQSILFVSWLEYIFAFFITGNYNIQS